MFYRLHYFFLNILITGYIFNGIQSVILCTSLIVETMSQKKLCFATVKSTTFLKDSWYTLYITHKLPSCSIKEIYSSWI